jgi:predicted dehydrogenase
MTTRQSGTIGVGVVGLGFGERVHLPGWAALRDRGTEIRSVCARDPERAAAAAARYGAVEWTTNWRDVVADPGVQLVSVATPPALHAEICAAALHAGKAVFCEKPLGLNAASAHSIARIDGPPVLVNFSFRGLPEMRALHRSVASRKVDHFSVVWHVKTRDDTDWSWSWKDSSAAGGGALGMYGVHVFDYIQWLLGPITDIRADVIQATEARRGSQGASQRVVADKAFRARVVLRDGALGDIDVSLDGTESTHRIALGRIAVELPDWPSSGPRDCRIEPFTILASELISAIRERRPATPSALDGARALALVESARTSTQ